MGVLLQGATVVDGTRSPARRGDVRVEGGTIVEVGPDLPVGGDQTVDLDGLVLAPGFIDPHTHFDAQVLWDPDLTPSSWHGVTTVVTGNCGFTLAPIPAACRDEVVEMLSVVEGMSRPCLEAGIPWDFETFPEYLDVLDGRPKRLNLAPLVGHSALRYAAMGVHARQRPATADELEVMVGLVDEALEAGALGLSTSRSTSHVGAGAAPVPSRMGAPDELERLAGPLRRRGQGIVEATWGPDLFVEELSRLSVALERPVTWAAALTQPGRPEWTARIREATHALPGAVYPQMSGKPLRMQVDLAATGTFPTLPAFAAALSLPRPDRLGLFADPSWRAVVVAEMAASDWAPRLERAVVDETVAHPALIGGPTLGELAAGDRRSALEVLLDLALADDLQTRWSMVLMNDQEDELAAMFGDDRLVLGLSDAGAHATQLCDADASTYLLSHWWRERQVVSLEDAVWRLTGQPAELFGLEGRGRIAPGMVADLTAFDPDRVGGLPPQRVADLPGGADRIVVDSVGIERVWVRGTEVRRDGRPVAGAYPGAVLRGGRG